MKKVIAVILTIVMLFALTSCGGELTASSQSVSARLTGNGKTKLKLTLKGSIEECTEEISMAVSAADETTFYSVQEKKNNGKTRVYTISPIAPGGADFHIVLKGPDEKVVANVVGFVAVDDDLHISCTGLSVISQEYYSFANHEADADMIRVPKTHSRVALLGMKKLEGHWEPESFDELIVNPENMGLSDGGYEEFLLNPVGEGDTVVQFLDLDAMKQMLIFVSCTASADEAGNASYSSSITDYLFADYSLDEYLTRRGQDATLTKMQAFDPDFRIPGDYIVEGFEIRNSKKNEAFVFDETESLATLEIPAEFDTMEADLRKEDKTVVLSVSTEKTLKKEYNEMEALGKPNAVDDLSLSGVNVRIYQTSYGFSCAIWEENSKVYKATLIYDDPSLDTDKALLRDFFDNR